MRAIVLDNVEINIHNDNQILVVGDKAHHLIKVVRIKENDFILVIGDVGTSFKCHVLKIESKNITLQIDESLFSTRKYNIDLALCLPKKDNFEASIKSMVEMGVRKVYLLKSDFSQLKIEQYNQERLDRLINQAMEQSNNNYKLEIDSKFNSIDDLTNFYQAYESLFCFSSKPNTNQNQKSKNLSSDRDYLIVIGPEGGFSSREELLLDNIQNVHKINLPSPIMKTITAVPASIGYIMAKLGF